MSKLAILKELTDLKTMAQRASSFKRWAFVGALAYLMVGYGSDGWSYLSTMTRMAKDKVRSNVPLEFELERARTMIEGLIPDVRRNMLVIAQEEVGVDHLQQEVERTDSDLGKQRDEMMRLRAQLEGKTEPTALSSATNAQNEVKKELTRRFERYQASEAMLASRKQVLIARKSSLDAARTKLDNMLKAKRDLEVQVENLQARLKSQQSHSLASSVEVNDTEVAHCQTLVNDIRVRLEVADRLLAGGEYVPYAESAPVSDDIAEQIDRHFAKANDGPSLATVR